MIQVRASRCMMAAFSCAAVLLLLLSCTGAPAPRKDQTLSELVMKGDLEGIKKFYSNQEQLNLKDAQGLYPLHYAVVRGDPQIAEMLMVLGAKLDVKDPAGKTPLRYSIDRKQAAISKVLVERGADVFAADASGSTPAEAALNAGPETLGVVFTPRNVNSSGSDGRTILHLASDRLLVPEVTQLLEIGASVQSRDKADRTALDLALLYPEDRKAAMIAEKLIIKGANPSFSEFAWFAATVRSADYGTVRFSNGNTPLHESIARFQYGFADFLLSKGLTPNIKNMGGDAPLHLAVQSGWKDGAELLLRNGADPDIRNSRNNTALHLPVPQSVRLEMTRLLLRFKADPSLKDSEGNTALHKAVKLSYEPLIVEALIEAGAPVNSANQEGDTPLMICVKAGNYQYAEALVKAGADVFLRNIKGDSPLSIAVGRGAEAVDRIILQANVLQRDNAGNSVISTAVALKGAPEVISLILAKGGDPNVRNNAGDNTLHVAVRGNLSAQGAILLAAKTDIFAVNAAQETPVFLALAAKDGPYDWFFIPSVITARDTNGDTPGHLAARKNLAEGLEYLAGRGADLNAVNSARESLLHAAAKTDAADAARYLIASGADKQARDINGDAPLNTAVLSNAKTCLQVFILSGVDLDARNYTGEAALHQAVRKQYHEFVSYLVDRGAAIEARDNRGLTPLAVACRETKAGIAQTLISAGAIVDARDYAGTTPLYFAVEAGQLDLVKALVSAGADILARNAAGDCPLGASTGKGPTVLRELLSDSTKNRADAEGKTPLRHLIDMKAPLDMIQLALSAGADPDRMDRYACTALHGAIASGYHEAAAVLLAGKANPFAPDCHGVTPVALVLGDGARLKDFVLAAGIDRADIKNESFLHYAVRSGNAGAAKLLLELGADASLRNIGGETALDVAKAKNNQEIIALLPAAAK